MGPFAHLYDGCKYTSDCNSHVYPETRSTSGDLGATDSTTWLLVWDNSRRLALTGDDISQHSVRLFEQSRIMDLVGNTVGRVRERLLSTSGDEGVGRRGLRSGLSKGVIANTARSTSVILCDSVKIGGVDSSGDINGAAPWRAIFRSFGGLILGDSVDSSRDRICAASGRTIRTVRDGTRAFGNDVKLRSVEGLGGIPMIGSHRGPLLSDGINSGRDGTGLSYSIENFRATGAIFSVVRTLCVCIDSSGVNGLGGIGANRVRRLGVVGTASLCGSSEDIF